jgi:hypothetical protein
MSFPFSFWKPAAAGGGNNLLTSLLAHYDMGGTLSESDSTANARTLTEASGLVPTSAAGKIGNARFAAGDSRFLYSSDVAFKPGAGPFSVSFWVYLTAGASGFPGLIGKYDTGASQRCWCVLLDASSVPYLEVSTDGSTVAASVSWTGGLSTGTWHHIVAVISGSQLRISVNGGTFQDAAFSGTCFNSSADMTVLCRLSSGSAAGSHNGGMDHIDLWNKALTSTDVSNLNNGGAGLAYGSYT